MLTIEIPGFGDVHIGHLVTDFTGTLSVDGTLLPGVADLLSEVGHKLTVHVLTADTFQKAHSALEGVDCRLTVLSGASIDRQKEEYVQNLGPEQVVAIGNGANDRLMLKTARIGISVIEGEGCAFDAVSNADVIVRSIHDGLALVINPKRLVATLRV